MWTCKKCNEKIEDNFDECWNCAVVKDESVKSFQKDTIENKSEGNNSRLYQFLFLITALFYSIKNTYFGEYGFLNKDLVGVYNKIFSDAGINQQAKAKGIFDPELLGSFFGSFIGIIIIPIIAALLIYFFTKKNFRIYAFIFRFIFTSYRLLNP